MRFTNFYNSIYLRNVEKKLRVSYFAIFALIFSVIALGLTSILLSIYLNFHTLLYFNLPLSIIAMIVLFTLIQIYIPTYRWELKFAKKITSTSIQIVSGKIINVVHYADYYDHQRMSSIIISSDKREIQLYIRPWLYRQIFKNGENIEFEVVSKVIVSYKTGEQT